MDRAPPARDGNGPASMAAELEARLPVMELLVAEKCDLATIHLHSLALSIEDPGTNPAAFSCFVLTNDDLRQSIPAPGIVAIRNSSSQQQSVRCAAAILMACWGFFV